MSHAEEARSWLLTAAPMQAIASGASPYVFTAPDPGRVVVQGGTVTLIELGRGGAFVPTGIIVGVVPVSRGDQVRTTYVVAPTITYFKQ